MVRTFTELFQWLDQLGVLESMIPFLLIFTIVFAILQKSNILGDRKKNLNVIMSLLIGLAVIIPHTTNAYPAGADVVDIINKALPNVSIVLVAIVMVLLLLGIFGLDIGWLPNPGGVLAIIAIIIIIFIFGNAAGWWYPYGMPVWLSWLDDPDVQALILILLVFGVIIWYIVKDDIGDGQTATGVKEWVEGFGKMLGGGKS